MSVSKKTGLYLEGINVPIVDRVMNEHNYSSISRAINFIIQEYSRLSNNATEKPITTPAPTSISTFGANNPNYNDWFVVEEK